MYYYLMMISVVFLKNLYYSTFLLPKTILISGLFVTFVYGYKSLIYWKSHSTLTLLATQNYPFWLKYD